MADMQARRRRRPEPLRCEDGHGTVSDVKVKIKDGEYSEILLAHKHILRQWTWFENCLKDGRWKVSESSGLLKSIHVSNMYGMLKHRRKEKKML